MSISEQIQEEEATFCKNIKILRERNNISKKKMAEILGIGAASLTKIEQEILPQIGADVFLKASQKFSIKPQDLFRPL